MKQYDWRRWEDIRRLPNIRCKVFCLLVLKQRVYKWNFCTLLRSRSLQWIFCRFALFEILLPQWWERTLSKWQLCLTFYDNSETQMNLVTIASFTHCNYESKDSVWHHLLTVYKFVSYPCLFPYRILLL